MFTALSLLAFGSFLSSFDQAPNWPEEAYDIAVSEAMEDEFYPDDPMDADYYDDPVDAAIYYEDGPYDGTFSTVSEWIAEDLGCRNQNAGRFVADTTPGEASNADIEALLRERQTDRHNLVDALVFTNGADATYVDQDWNLIEVIQVARTGTDWEVILSMSCADHVEYREQFMSTPATTTPPNTTPPTTAIAITTTTTIPNGRPVPDVVELDVNEAILVLFDWDLEIDRRDQHSDQLPAGSIIGTEPITGTMVAPGTVVTMVVSSGPAIEAPAVDPLDDAVLLTESDIDETRGLEKTWLHWDGTLHAGDLTGHAEYWDVDQYWFDKQASLSTVQFDETRLGIVLALPTPEEEDPPNIYQVFVVNDQGLSRVFDSTISTYGAGELTFHGDGTMSFVEDPWTACRNAEGGDVVPIQRLIFSQHSDGQLVQSASEFNGQEFVCSQLAG